MSEELGTPFTSHELLWSDNDRPEELPAALELIRTHENEADVLVVVSHYEYTERFPTYFGREVLDAEIPKETISKGTARVIDCEAKTCITIHG